MTAILCADVGSTFTKGCLVDAESGELLATASRPTSLSTDVLDALAEVRVELERRAGVRAAERLVCSSAGGGLRIAVVGYERAITAEAGTLVALSAGGVVVHRHAGRLNAAGLTALRAAQPDVVLLVGGTDGGNADVLLHNAEQLDALRARLPIVIAGNAEAADTARGLLERRGRSVAVAANVLPQIGVLEPIPARTALREVFLRHVIGGKGLSRGRVFAALVRAATPDAVLTGVELLADGVPEAGVTGAGDVLLVDVGGATTDVYSVINPSSTDGQRQPGTAAGVPQLWRSRTVEGDLGVRWSAPGVVAAALAEGLLEPADAPALLAYAQQSASAPAAVPTSRGERAHDLRLAQLAVTVAVRRHGRPAAPGADPRPLRRVKTIIGSGGVLRHASEEGRASVLAPLLADHAGGWRVPERAALAVDAQYVLFAAGLLADLAPVAASTLAASTHESPLSPSGWQA